VSGPGRLPGAGTAAPVPAFGAGGFRSAGPRGQTGPVRRNRVGWRAAVAAALLPGALLLLLLGAGTAAADVVVVPEQVDPGAREVTLAFRITEDDPAARPVRLQVFLPTGRPLVGVRAPAPPGWSTELTRTELPAPAPSQDGPAREIVTAVEWTATAPAPPIVELPILVDVMPDGAGPVRFRAVRTDASGRTDEWSDTWAEGAPPPAHDALRVRLGAVPPPPVVPAGHGDHHGDQAAVASAAPTDPATAGAAAVTVGGALLVGAGVAGLAVALGRRQRQRFAALTGDPGPPRPAEQAAPRSR
jgi:Domain of unkown function (DUF1775)